MSATAVTSAPTLPPKGAPIQTILSAVGAIIKAGDIVALSALRAQAAERIDLTTAIAVNLVHNGRADDATGVIEAFIAQNGRSAEAYDALGAIRLAIEDADGATAAFRAALDLDPDSLNAASNLFNVLINQSKFAEAADLKRRHPQAQDGAPERTVKNAAALILNGQADIVIPLLKPIEDDPHALTVLGEAYFRCYQKSEAYAAWEKALTIDPDYQLGLVKQAIGLQLDNRYDDALDSIERAEALSPDALSVQTTKAAVLVGLKRYQDAIDILESIEKTADSWGVLASAYVNKGDGPKAKEASLKCLEVEENNFYGRQNLVLAHLRCHDNNSAEREARKTIALIEEGFYKLGAAQTPILHGQADALGQAMARQGLADLAHEFRKKYIDDPHIALSFFQNYLFELHYTTTAEADFIATEHRKINRILLSEIPKIWDNLYPEKSLRIGLMSPDFRHHSCGYFMFTLLKGLRERGVDVLCFANLHAGEDDLTEKFKDTASAWIDISTKTDIEARELVIENQIDILIDCVGYTAGSRPNLFSLRAAPVQITWLGYPDGSGIHAMDYRLTDALAEPPEADRLYSEKLVRLPHGFLCFPEYEGAPAVTPTPALETGTVTFGSFNATPKMNDRVIRIWSEIIKKVPNSRLLLKSSYIEPEVVENMKQRFFDHGLSEEQLVLSPWSPGKIEHLGRYAAMDINLDPFPYNGTTTTMEATFMGVPTVTLRGDRHSALVGVALNTRFGAPELVAESEEDYIALAVSLAGDLDKLNGLRLGLRDRMRASEMMNAQNFAADVSHALREIWRARCHTGERTDSAAAEAGDAASIDVRTVGGVTISAPATTREMTSYILLEKEDWLERELSFVRKATARGSRAIDIGGNYGHYALNIAHAAGPDGRVVAFEPAARTASYLRRSIEKNGLQAQVTLVQAAVSDEDGEGVLETRAAELRALTKTDIGETVQTLRLDSWIGGSGFEQPDFVKMDAEGAEPAIIDGGRAFFETASPLVMFEVKHGADLDMAALEKLEALGYRAYALIEGLGLLAPADPRAAQGSIESLDNFTLNLFCAKPDRAATLAARKLLVEERVDAEEVDSNRWEDALASRAFWPGFMALKPDFINPDKALPGHAPYRRALARFAAMEASDDPAQKLAQLEAACADAREALAYHRAADRLLTTARLCAMDGRRDQASRCLREARLALSQLDLTLSEPFLPPTARFDALDAKDDFINWFEAAVLESLEMVSAFSTYFRRTDENEVYEALEGNRFVDAEIPRRAQLVALRNRSLEDVRAEPRLQAAAPDHRNPELWTGPQIWTK